MASAMSATRGQYLGSRGRAFELALAVEDVASGALADGHAEIDVQADAGDAHAGILLVGGEQVRIVVGVVVVRVARMAAGLRLLLRLGGHGGWGNVSCAVDGRGPIERAARRGCGAFSRGLEDAQLWAGDWRAVGAGQDQRTR